VRPSKRFIVAAVAIAALAGSGYGLAAAVTVNLTPSGADPPRVTVALGDTVTFVNNTPESRALTSGFEGFGTTTIPSGASHEYLAAAPGTIAYRYGSERTDRGSIVVQRVGSVTLAAGSKSVTFGKTVTLAGRAVPSGFPVLIEQRARDGSDWKQLTTVTPASEGTFTFKLKPALGGQYRASTFEGVLRSSRVSVKVKPNIRLASSVRGTRTGRTINLRVYVAPADAAARVTLSRYNVDRNSWGRVSTHPLINGRAVIPWKVEKGTARLRVSISRRDVKQGLEGADSKLIVLRGIGPDPAAAP
jgi:hypothetical protein